MDNPRDFFSDSDLLTVSQAAEFIGGKTSPLAKSTLHYWRSTGSGPCFYKLGNSIRYRVADLKAFLIMSRQNIRTTHQACDD